MQRAACHVADARQVDIYVKRTINLPATARRFDHTKIRNATRPSRHAKYCSSRVQQRAEVSAIWNELS